jgi:hypothetical protein
MILKETRWRGLLLLPPICQRSRRLLRVGVFRRGLIHHQLDCAPWLQLDLFGQATLDRVPVEEEVQEEEEEEESTLRSSLQLDLFVQATLERKEEAEEDEERRESREYGPTAWSAVARRRARACVWQRILTLPART